MTAKYRWLLGLIAAFFLSGCQTSLANKDSSQLNKSTAIIPKKIIKDAAPSGPIPTLFALLKPIYEPFSRYGNPDSYTVDGKRYIIMSNPRDYKARGMASWYATKFHQKRTSSGEAYNMYALTAAHRTLPLPTYIRVKNLANGRKIIVKVNDRGPFHSNRLIDLSYGAAVKLGIFPKGTATVEIQALQAANAPKIIARYYIQTGAFRTHALAKALQIRLKKRLKAPIVIENYRGHFLVTVGPIANLTAANIMKKRLKAERISQVKVTLR